MKWFELIFMSLIGILCLYLGWEIWKKEKITLIHDYHHKRVKDIDKKAYTGQMGKGMLIIGAGVMLTGIVDFITTSLFGWCFFVIGFSIGLVMMTHAQIKYNHGIF
ncbi:DUF3784 domain-containing protein [Coprococcus sp. AF21-14LB]|uniref:DUF3784 domain-containing protein n=1 Tax=Coprococcus sp. AF21-14LB TaxID=2292231 RepID=UPI001FA82662|nr:DUF3784 domain-containing protein [Coprococcus sp. AF21-14LB]